MMVRAAMKEKPRFSHLHSGPGFRIRKTIERPPRELIEALAEFETPDISDLLNRLYTMAPRIRNLVNDDAIVGPACTVKLFPGDNLMVHKALDIAQPGDIIVVDTGRCEVNAIVGDMIAQKAKHRGIKGFVIDGLARDLPGLREVGLPVFACGVTPVGPLQRGPGELNHAICCGDIVVLPGDIVLADGTGLTVVRREAAADILVRAREQKAAIAGYMDAIRAGEFSNAWVDEILDHLACHIDG